MDAKSRANFINSVATGQSLPCPKCNTLNEANSKYCEYCGTSLEKPKGKKDIPFSLANKEEGATKKGVVQESVESKMVFDENDELESVFAEGLPSWNIEPPQVLVRRKKR